MTARGEFDGLEGFLGDRERDRGDFGGLLKWRKNNPPAVTTLMSVKRKPIKLFRHGFPEVVSYEKDGEQVSRVFTRRVGCWEPHSILENQNWRDRETGERVVKYDKNDKSKLIAAPPATCPVCLFIEWLRALVVDGKLGLGFAPVTWKEKGEEKTGSANHSLIVPVFKLQGESDDNATVITAGGFCGLYKEKNLDDADKRLLSRSGIQLTEAWKENGQASKNYLFTVCDYDNMGDGLVKAIESSQLGEAVIKVIADEIEANGKNPDKGNPFKNPYPIRWKYAEKAQLPDPKYTAVLIRDVEITEEILSVLRSDPPDVTEETSYLDSAKMREVMESSCVLEGVTIPWDNFFKEPQPGGKPRSDSAKANVSAPKAPPKESKPASSSSSPKGSVKDPKNPLGLDPEADSTCGCECPVSEGSEELCGGFMGVTDDTCPVCGAVYDLAASPVSIKKRPWDKAKPAPRGRAQATAPTTPATGSKGGPVPGSEDIPF
jgi:hypothetical protein